MNDNRIQYRWKLHWLGGTTEEVVGPTISEAFTLAGYGAGAVRALDWYECVDIVK